MFESMFPSRSNFHYMFYMFYKDTAQWNINRKTHYMLMLWHIFSNNGSCVLLDFPPTINGKPCIRQTGSVKWLILLKLMTLQISVTSDEIRSHVSLTHSHLSFLTALLLGLFVWPDHFTVYISVFAWFSYSCFMSTYCKGCLCFGWNCYQL